MGEDKEKTCPYCGRVFESEKALTVHLRKCAVSEVLLRNQEVLQQMAQEQKGKK